jgi:hypothetical protein
VDLDVGVALVVLEADVVARAVLLDEVHLQDQRFELGADHDPLDIGDALDELAGLVVVLGAGVEVGAQAGAQVDRLADVDRRRSWWARCRAATGALTASANGLPLGDVDREQAQQWSFKLWQEGQGLRGVSQVALIDDRPRFGHPYLLSLSRAL